MITKEQTYSLFYYKMQGVPFLSESKPAGTGVAVSQYDVQCIDEEEFKAVQTEAWQAVALRQGDPIFPMDMQLVGQFNT